MKRLLLGLLVLFSSAVSGSAAEASVPKVVVSLKPIHSLVSGVMAGVGEPILLVKGAASPHGYVLRPSEARALAQADLIVWVGSSLEGFLEKPLKTLGHSAQTLELAGELKDKLLLARRGGNWEADSHQHREADHLDHGQEVEHGDHQEERPEALAYYDHHIWLSPDLAKEIVRLTARQLVTLDPGHAETYDNNSKSLLARIDQLDTRIGRQLQPIRKVPYLVFHAAYQYFEAAYGLNAVGSVAVDPEHRPGVKRVREIRDKIMTSGARCVFSEPQFEARLIATLIEGTNARTGILDPLGIDLEANQDAYFILMERLAENLYLGLAD